MRCFISFSLIFQAIINYKDQSKIDPHYVADVKFGFAFFNFSFSLFPPNLMFIVEALGFKAGKFTFAALVATDLEIE